MTSPRCVFNQQSAVVGWRFQCAGHLYASLDFRKGDQNCADILSEEQCSEHHPFGPGGFVGDTYDNPAVMACCAPYEPEYRDHYFDYCTYDLFQQVCGSAAARLQKLVEDGAFSIYTGQAAALQQFVAANYTACFASLRANDTDPSAAGVHTHWAVPNSPDWPALEDFVLRIDEDTEISGLMQPADMDDWAACTDASENNDNVFEGSTPPPPGGVVLDLTLGEDASGHLRGPVILGGPVVSEASFPEACASKGCSQLSLWSQGPDSLQVQDLTLVADAFVVSNQNGTQMPVDSLRISLFDHALATPVYDPDGELGGFELPAGSAHFLLAPAAAGVYSQLIATTNRPLLLRETPQGWTASELELSYLDDSGNTWTVRVDPSTWSS